MLLHGASSEPSALLKVQGSVRNAGGRETPVQPMIDSGASGMGFVDPRFVKRCGARIEPSSRKIVLADGSEVEAAGEATLSYSLQAMVCGSKGDSTQPAQFTSKFIVTSLESFELILGVGWLEQHHAQIGFRERSIQLRVDGAGEQQCIRPLARCNRDGSTAAEAAPVKLLSITQRALCKAMRRKEVEELFVVLVRPQADAAAAETQAQSAAAATPAVPGSEDPLIKPLLNEFASVFQVPKPGIPPKRGVEHSIKLMPGTVPPAARPLRHQSARDSAFLQEYVAEGVKAGTIQLSTSPYGSMALIVLKKDGTPRVVIDYRALNEVTVKNKYPLPLMDELFDRTQGAQFFTSIDLRNGFHQIAIPPEDREKTAFRTRFGHYEYTVLPMGLCNAPGTFMQLMNETFADMLDRCVLCFLDDILIFSRTREQHVKDLREVLTRLKKQQLYAKMSKCAFMQKEVAFLGHRIGADGLRVAADKVGAVQSWPTPSSVTEVRSFLGLANFYRRFVKDYSKLALPLTELTKEVSGPGFSWGAEQQKAFAELKAALCSPPVLLVPDQSKPFVLNTDACKFAIGAVLQQDHGNGLQPIAYFSAKMSSAERNYDVREQEFMALLRACQHWRQYLHSDLPFTLRTDHESLKYVKSMKNLTGRMARWVEQLAEFNFDIEHIPGKDNAVADPLSRRADLAAVQARAMPHTPLRSILKKGVTFRSPNVFDTLAAADQPAPSKAGIRTIITPTHCQRCTANTNAGVQCAQRAAVAHLCWNHLIRDKGLRVQKSHIAGKGLFAAWKDGLPGGHSVPYTGGLIEKGIHAARHNSGLGRWVNDPRGAFDAEGKPRKANCEFTVYTPRGQRQRVGSVRTLRHILRGEELLIAYGNQYWRYQLGKAAGAKAAECKRHSARKGSVPKQRQPPTRALPVRARTAVLMALDIVQRRSPRFSKTVPAAQPAASAVSSSAVSVDGSLLEAMRSAAASDAEYQQAMQSPAPGMLAQGGLLTDAAGHIRVPADAVLRTRILAELHDAPTGAHCGRDRLLAELQRRFVWQGMAAQAEQYVLTCDSCQRNKHSKQLTPGLLMPLPIPEEPCMHWTTDAVTGLPKTKAGFDAIQVYVDRLTKLKHFAVAHTSDGSVQLANNTLRTIIGPHGVPKSMVSDRDTRITAKYWKELQRLLGSTVSLSTAYHPQSDGQSEREIQTLTVALRSYANSMGNDWDEYLPALELAFNSKQQASTGASPFALVYGQEARLPIDCALDGARSVQVPAAGDRAARMQKAMNCARSRTEQAQERQRKAADRKRRLLLLKPGDQVLLSTEGLRLRSGTHKLTSRFIGPFTVTGSVNDNAVTLELPPLLDALHSTFNISRLKVYRDGRTAFPTRPQRLHQPPAVDSDTNGVSQYEVESVLAQRSKGSRREMLVRWKGYGAEDDMWQLRQDLTRTAPEAVAEFLARQYDGAVASSQLMTQ